MTENSENQFWIFQISSNEVLFLLVKYHCRIDMNAWPYKWSSQSTTDYVITGWLRHQIHCIIIISRSNMSISASNTTKCETKVQFWVQMHFIQELAPANTQEISPTGQVQCCSHKNETVTNIFVKNLFHKTSTFQTTRPCVSQKIPNWPIFVKKSLVNRKLKCLCL